MLVRELREILDEYPDDWPVIIAAGSFGGADDLDWAHSETVENVWDGIPELSAVVVGSGVETFQEDLGE